MQLRSQTGGYCAVFKVGHPLISFTTSKIIESQTIGMHTVRGWNDYVATIVVVTSVAAGQTHVAHLDKTSAHTSAASTLPQCSSLDPISTNTARTTVESSSASS